MKKILVWGMILALMISALALPSLAEEAETQSDAVTSATQQSGKGGHGGRQQPAGGQMPDQNGQDSRMPGMDGRNARQNQNGQMPQAPDQNGQNNQAPQQPGQNGQNEQSAQQPDQNGTGSQSVTPCKGGRGNQGGKQNGKQNRPQTPAQRLNFDQMLTDGVITQEIYDSIMNYMKERTPQQADGTAPAEGAVPPALPDGTAPAEGSEPPALPDNAQGDPAGMEEQLLKELLETGVITQEQYDLLLTKIASSAASSDT